MNRENFIVNLNEIYRKSGILNLYNDPFAYDEDEEGFLFLEKDGTIKFNDHQLGWNDFSINVSDVIAMKYKKGKFLNEESDNEVEEISNYVKIYFNNDYYIEIIGWYSSDGTCRSNLSVNVCFTDAKKNEDLISKLEKQYHIYKNHESCKVKCCVCIIDFMSH